jgi:hypothetical protein
VLRVRFVVAAGRCASSAGSALCGTTPQSTPLLFPCMRRQRETGFQLCDVSSDLEVQLNACKVAISLRLRTSSRKDARKKTFPSDVSKINNLPMKYTPGLILQVWVNTDNQ